ncbi:MAG: sugar phosphate isomerase/epimerase family protein [Planctomycetaceae bacterium]
MVDVAVSQMTSARWDLVDDVAMARALGFDAVALWRPKVSDMGAAAAGRLLATSGIRASSLQWVGGFTGGDGRSFAESVDDALEALAMAEAVAAPVLVVHGGCRAGHTRSHAQRLLTQALEILAPEAARADVTLAVKPMHPTDTGGCGFLADLADAVAFVERIDDPAVRLALDLWHFADDPALVSQLGTLVGRLAAVTAVVQVADRCGPPVAGADRLPIGLGELPLEAAVADLVAAGYAGPVECDPVGEMVELLGYDGVWRETRLVADAWGARRMAEGVALPRSAARPGSDHFRAAGAGIRKSHASSHSGSAG